MSKTLITTLTNLGLAEPEINAYVQLLKLNGATASVLAQAMGIKRTTAYPILERLYKQNLVSMYNRGAYQFYAPIRPNRLASLYERRLADLVSLVPFLESLGNNDSHEYGVRFIQSRTELKSFYRDILDEYAGKSYYSIGSTPAWMSIDPDFFRDYMRRRTVRGTTVKLLLSHDSRGMKEQQDETLRREYKYLPKQYIFRSTIDIYNDKVVIIGPDVKALAVVIAIPPMVDVFRSMFEIIWQSLPDRPTKKQPS
ncbi:MAG: hypothetical protein KBB55_03115 [Candidatus Buchananbacteria bacterium]|nr:hypothetical protein [Candidatus Buchananbacteria bacterium]